MAEVLTFRMVTTDWPVEEAVALARTGGFLPGLDMVALPAGLDVERANGLLGGTAATEGDPVVALRTRPGGGVEAGDLGMIQADGRGLAVLVGDYTVPYDPRDFAPARAMTYLRLQGYGGRFRHVVAASGPSTDLRYIAVAAGAATAEVTVLGTPDQIFRMVGPRDQAGIPVTQEFRIAVAAGGRHKSLRVVGEGGAVLADLVLGSG